MSKSYTIRTSDDELVEWMAENVDNNSGWIEQAMKDKMVEDRAPDEPNGDLTAEQRFAYKWLCKTYEHGQGVDLEVVKNQVAQRTSLNMDVVQADVIRALENKGMVKVVPRLNDVVVKVNKRAKL